MKSITQVLSKNSKLEVLDLCKSYLNIEFIAETGITAYSSCIADMLKENQTLYELILSNRIANVLNFGRPFLIKYIYIYI